MYRKIFLFLLPIASIAISGIQSDIRCHCNQPVCVRTGYMCKSKGPQAGCFVEHSGHVNMDRSSDISRHGCIEMLPIDERLSCLELALAINTHHNHNHHGTLMHNHRHVQNKQNRPSPSFRTNNKTITCCLDDMCNYVKTIVADDLQNSDDNNNNDDGNVDDPLEHRKQNPRPNHHHQQSRNHDFNSHYRTTQSLSNNDQFDSLGRQLQESYGIDDSLQQEVPLGFIISFIVILFIILVALIFCVICYIRNDVNKNQQLQHHQQQHPQRFCKSDGMGLPPYSSKPNTSNFTNNNNILSWRNLMNPKKNSSYPGRIMAGKNCAKLFKTSHQQQQQQQHPSLLLIVNNCQMDNPMMTKLDDDEQDAFEIPGRCVQPSSKPNNLPNIISVHSLPNPDNDFKIEFNDATINNKETTFDVASLSPSATRMEKQNSIYMSPGQVFNTDSLIPQHHSTTAHGKRSDFDLISNTSNPNPIV